MLAVLVVEDEPTVRIFLSEALADAGYEALEAGTGDDALTILQARDDIRAMITDVELPGSVDGFGLARTAMHRRPDMVVVVASGRTWPSDGKMPDGALWVQKPYPAEFLLKLLAERLPGLTSQPVPASASAGTMVDNPITQGVLSEPVMEEPKDG